MKPRVIAIAIFAVAVSAVAAAATLTRVSSPPPAPKAGQAQQAARHEPQDEAALRVVEAKYVCMINNQRFDKEQIPVEVNGQTYYGCCEMCKGRLGGDPQSRVATDPVSGRQVDKAKAVIGVDRGGSAFYFENEDNLKRYKPGTKS